jgi:regulator of sirC expression with transglutaminase-like and TPR domain
MRACIVAFTLLAYPTLLLSQESTVVKPSNRTVEDLAAMIRKSIVVVSVTGRDGKQQGLGSGFVVDEGLIATNLHVIGEGRSFRVETADGKQHEVLGIHASDRKLDLAVIRVATKGLPLLPIGDPSTLKDGQAVVAMGNPQGLKFSVVAGVVSGRRELDGRNMIQVALPIEPGNSGSPLLDMQGRVHGVLTIKSLVTENLGFAVPADALQSLLKKPNPITISRWLTIGQLDSAEWKTSENSARWRQRAGRILVEGTGPGIGSRSLCIYQRDVPQIPYELTVTVKMDNESGAAGLIFHSDGQDHHYGFYPSNGQMRLTRFEGADVFTWKVLHQEPSPHYKPGDWNRLKVRIEKDKILCYVNDRLAVQSTDNKLTPGKVGLCKFRDTKAEFKLFQVGKNLEEGGQLSPEQAKLLAKATGTEKQADVRPLLPQASLGMQALRERARLLEVQAGQLRKLAQRLHLQRILDELKTELNRKEAEIDLLRSGLLLAMLDNEELDVEVYRREVERMAREVSAKLPPNATEEQRIEALGKYFFEERGFHGSRADYYHRSNSYLNEVIDDREGIPISLSVLYMELARRLKVEVVGVPFPGHFMTRHLSAKGEGKFIDVYEGGTLLTADEAKKRIETLTGEPPTPDHFKPASKRAIITRMAYNLLGLARRDRDIPGALRYLEVIVMLNPDSGEERWMRALLRYQGEDAEGAKEDCDWLLENKPPGLDLKRVHELQRLLEK